MAGAWGAPLTVILNGAVVLLGAGWFATQFPALRRAVRPIYLEMGIIPAPPEEMAPAPQAES
jgi:hypothetical protein